MQRDSGLAGMLFFVVEPATARQFPEPPLEVCTGCGRDHRPPPPGALLFEPLDPHVPLNPVVLTTTRQLLIAGDLLEAWAALGVAADLAPTVFGPSSRQYLQVRPVCSVEPVVTRPQKPCPHCGFRGQLQFDNLRTRRPSNPEARCFRVEGGDGALVFDDGVRRFIAEQKPDLSMRPVHLPLPAVPLEPWSCF